MRLVFRPEAQNEIFSAQTWYEDRALGLSSFNPLIGILMKTIGLKSLCIGCHCEPPESGPIPHTDCHVTTFLAMTVLFASSRGRRPWRSMPSEVMDCFTAFAMTTFFRINLSLP
jgi:hypothetical protein